MFIDGYFMKEMKYVDKTEEAIVDKDWVNVKTMLKKYKSTK